MTAQAPSRAQALAAHPGSAVFTTDPTSDLTAGPATDAAAFDGIPGRAPAPDTPGARTARLLAETAPVRNRVLRHALYRRLTDIDAVRVFMEHHVFAVWDFMSLLKTLQARLTCLDIPWTPQGTPGIRRLVNEIVLTEESDLTSLGPLSHFELYLEAMERAGADTEPALCFLDLLADGTPTVQATGLCGAPAGAVAFVSRTWQIVEHAPLHCVAGAFALGREQLIPRMFEHVSALDQVHHGRLGLFGEYLDRHIEVDGDEHGPMALRLVEELCGDDARAWRECAGTVTVCLRSRAQLWDDVHAAIDGHCG